MKDVPRIRQKGFSLIEVMVVIAIISILVSIALPYYANYVKQVNAVSCLSNRRNIELDEVQKIVFARPALIIKDSFSSVRCDSLHNNLWPAFTSLPDWMTEFIVGSAHASGAAESSSATIGTAYTCPSGGAYLWLVSDVNSPNYPKVGCSTHYGAIVVEQEPSPVFEVDSGVNLADNGDFENLERTPRSRGWTMLNIKQVDGWDSNNNKVEIWADGMQGVKAPSGEYFIELDTDRNRNKPDVLSRDIDTESGRVYIVQMTARARTRGTSDFEIVWGDESVSKISPTHGQWSEYSAKVVGNGEPINLAIAEIPGQNNGLGALIDSIQVITTDEIR